MDGTERAVFVGLASHMADGSHLRHPCIPSCPSASRCLQHPPVASKLPSARQGTQAPAAAHSPPSPTPCPSHAPQCPPDDGVELALLRVVVAGQVVHDALGHKGGEPAGGGWAWSTTQQHMLSGWEAKQQGPWPMSRVGWGGQMGYARGLCGGTAGAAVGG